MTHLRTKDEIKSDINDRISRCKTEKISLEESLEIIKQSIEDIIRYSGESGKKSLITSQQIINLVHEVIKISLVDYGVKPELIYPQLGQSKGEKTLAGFLKFKKQDICVFPNDKNPLEENIDFDGLFRTNTKEPYGELFSEHILSINVRSQLSSLGNNIDTMYERTYAEPLNLHRRVPKMVLGEIFLISVRQLEAQAVANKQVKYKTFTETDANYLEKYIKGFSALNLRASQRDDDFKYERVALIPVDFAQDPVKIYATTNQLKDDGLLPNNSEAIMDNLCYEGFIEKLLQVYEKRFGSGILS